MFISFPAIHRSNLTFLPESATSVTTKNYRPLSLPQSGELPCRTCHGTLGCRTPRRVHCTQSANRLVRAPRPRTGLVDAVDDVEVVHLVLSVRNRFLVVQISVPLYVFYMYL